MCEDGSWPEIMSLPASMRDTWRRYFNWRPLFKWAGLAFVLWEVLCRGWAWLSWWLDPLTHTYCTSSNTLSPLPDYFASLMWCMASQLAPPPVILVYCAIVFATSLTLFLLDLSSDRPTFKFQLRCRPATQPPAPLLPAFTPLWVLGVTFSTASADTTVSFRRMLFHLPGPDADRFHFLLPEHLKWIPLTISLSRRPLLGPTNNLVKTVTGGKTERERAQQLTLNGHCALD